MPYSIALYLDPETDAKVRYIWKSLAENKYAEYLHESGNRPHITLGIYEDIDLAKAEKLLEETNQTLLSFPLVFEYIGLFAQKPLTVFWGLAMTPQLQRLHDYITWQCSKFCVEPDFSYYHVGQWVPHCSLATEVKDYMLLFQIIDFCRQLPNPHKAWVEEIGWISFRPIKQIRSVKLRDSAARKKD
jgi:2'-5' RNA ligase